MHLKSDLADGVEVLEVELWVNGEKVKSVQSSEVDGELEPVVPPGGTRPLWSGAHLAGPLELEVVAEISGPKGGPTILAKGSLIMELAPREVGVLATVGPVGDTGVAAVGIDVVPLSELLAPQMCIEPPAEEKEAGCDELSSSP